MLAHNCFTNGFNCGKKLATQPSLPASLRTSSCLMVLPGPSMRPTKIARISKFFSAGNRISILLASSLITKWVPIQTASGPNDPFSQASFSPNDAHHNKKPMANFRL